MITSACSLAQKFHEGQKYGKYDYFHYHIRGVVGLIYDMAEFHSFDSLFTNRCVTIGYLHDILEDTDMTVDSLSTHFTSDIVSDVKMLTRPDDVEYLKYVGGLDRKAVCVVKYCDNVFNLTNSLLEVKNTKRIKRYQSSIQILEQKLYDFNIIQY